MSALTATSRKLLPQQEGLRQDWKVIFVRYRDSSEGEESREVGEGVNGWERASRRADDSGRSTPPAVQREEEEEIIVGLSLSPCNRSAGTSTGPCAQPGYLHDPRSVPSG